MSKTYLVCEACGKKAGERYQRLDGKWVDFPCLDSEIVAQYPGMAAREALKAKRAEQARRNFGSKEGRC